MSWIPRALKARKAQGKSLRERRQLDYAVAVLVLLSVYLVILLATGVVTVLNAFDPDLLDRVPVLGERALSIWQAIVLGLTTLGLWKSSHISALTSGAVGYIAVAGYLDRGDRRDNLVGEVAGLLEHIEEGKVDYEQVDMIAFSFGSIAALDAFFPEDAEPGPRFGKVRTLVTIGCPFDFVRTYWPTHFAGRVITGPGPAAWLNVYTPIDVLSSNFRDDTSTGPATVGIPIDSGNVRKPQNLAFRRGKTLEAMTRWEFWTFAALSSHSIYWGRKAESEDSVFRSIAPHLYKGETILG